MCTSCCLGKWIETHYSAIIYYRLKINIIVFTNTSRQTDCNTFYIEFDLSQKKKVCVHLVAWASGSRLITVQ